MSDEIGVLTKVCVKCKVAKGLDEFYIDKECKYGRKPRCRVCSSTRNPKHLLPIGTKRCSRCKCIKPIDEFRRRIERGPEARGSRCMNCEREAGSAWYRTNKERARTTSKEW